MAAGKRANAQTGRSCWRNSEGLSGERGMGVREREVPVWWSIPGQIEIKKLIREFLHLRDSTGNRNCRKGVYSFAERTWVRFDAWNQFQERG